MKCTMVSIAALLSGLLVTASALAQPQPNIIVIMLDDVPDDLSIMPRVSALLPQGTRYTNSFTNQPLCGPSRATFLTGQEGVNNGVTANGAFLPSLSGLVPQALRAAGYDTGMFGKMPNGTSNSVSASDFGFDEWATVTRINKHRYTDARLDINGTIKQFNGKYTTDAIYEHAELWIEKSRTKPYFAWVSAVGGHAPNIPAPRYEGACDSVPFEPGPAFNEVDVSDKPSFIQELPIGSQNRVKGFRDQCATIRADDEWIDKFVRRFASVNTCIFLTSDNGFLRGQHRINGKNFLYEESIRVPLVLWGCGASGGTDARLVSNVDIPATVYELSGATPGRPLDGRSIFGDERTNVPLMGIWSGKREVPRFSQGIRDIGWAYFEHDNGERELYDIGADPFQLNSVHAQPAKRKRVQRMRKKM